MVVERRLAGPVGVGIVFAVLLAAAAIVFVTSDPAPRQGSQSPPTGPVVLQLADTTGWVRLTPLAGPPREAFPEPMVTRTDGVCVGFGRIDFGPDDLRPSLARCEPDRSPAMDPNEIRSIVAIASGFDTWHFLEAAAPIETVTLQLVSGEAVSADRIHLAESTMALRLENGHDVASIEWSTDRGRFRCTADAAAWQTATFCATS